MIPTHFMRSPALLLAACLTAVMLQACGGSGGSGSGASPTALPIVQPSRPIGNTPTPRPVDTPLPTPTSAAVTLHPGGSLIAALRSAPPGSTVVVAPGIYPALSVQASDLHGPVTLLADVSGLLSETGAAPVIISARGATAAIQLSGVTGLIIDGFTLEGGHEEGLLVLDSPETVVRNCVLRRNQGDGVFVERSNDTLIFNNAALDNTHAGIRVFGTNDLRVINNTVYNNRDNGIVIGDTEEPSASVTVENNIVTANTPRGIVVEASTTEYQGDFNLNTDGYGPDTPAGAADINANPLFLDPRGDDFHLAASSPAVNAGTSNIDADLVIALEGLSTQSDSSLDTAAPDLGYHYAPPPPTPTPVPRATRTGARTVVPGTPGATHTPTHIRIGTATPTNTHRGPAPRPTPTPRH